MIKIFIFSAFLVLTFFDGISQNVGIGTNTPVAKLEIRGESNAATTNNLVLKNLIGDTLLRMRNDGKMGVGYNGLSFGRTINIGGNGTNYYTSDTNFGGAIFPTDSTLVIWSEATDLNYVILQPFWGKVGIGTNSPQAKLHADGTVILGENGTLISNVIKVAMSKNLATVPANSATTETFTVAGAAPGSSVIISPSLTLADGLLIAYARVSSANIVELKIQNVTSVAINPATMSFYITIIE